MNSSLSGRCSCGAIRYQTNRKAKFSIICQCRQCQRITGAGNAPAFAVRADQAEVTGELKFYQQKAQSGHTVSNGFCVNCGNPILKKTTKMPDLLFFHAATLDEPSLFTPQIVVYESSAQPWDYVDPAIPRG